MRTEQGVNTGRPEVVLTDGTVLSAEAALRGKRVLMIWMRDENDPANSLTGLSELLSREGITRTITRVQDESQTEYTGFTQLKEVRVYQGGLCCARLEKED